MLAGRRLLGWIVGLVYGAVSSSFPQALLVARAGVGFRRVGGIATLLGPLIGGVFAQTGQWRLLFWILAAQSLAFAAAALVLVPQSHAQDGDGTLPLARLAVLGRRRGC